MLLSAHASGYHGGSMLRTLIYNQSKRIITTWRFQLVYNLESLTKKKAYSTQTCGVILGVLLRLPNFF
ncbi:hypothetical protein F0562_022188 [Nyssa sinensis]|uniref:Uncharacterized protein n=1 Tax=Nyssa sinensis TaxID=561372 RepID=A0A5J5BNB5_9ASTE|nr:hypothetical protein F0562_022188 [Nyssa sinensis]